MTGLRDITRAEPAPGRSRIAAPLRGRAVIEAVSEAGVAGDGNPVMELRLRVHLADRKPYTASVRQVLSRHVVHALAPGLELQVTVDASDLRRIELS